MAARLHRLLIFLAILFSLFCRSLSVPTASITEATDVLSTSGFVSMGLTLKLVRKLLTTPAIPAVMIFSPPDAVFTKLGQPSLSLLQFHFCPHPFLLESLQALPFGAKIRTMNPNHTLTVTRSAGGLEINGVKVVGSAIYNDGRLAVFGIGKFFDPQFGNLAPSNSPRQNANNPQCAAVIESYPTGSGSYGGYCFQEANELLRSTGCSIMAAFLSMQAMASKDQKIQPLTIFAPLDQYLMSHVGNFSEYPSVFLRHVVPCKLSLDDMLSYSNGTTLRTKLEGFTIEINRVVGDYMTLNGVPVTYPDMYQNKLVSIHGIGGVLPPTGSQTQE